MDVRMRLRWLSLPAICAPALVLAACGSTVTEEPGATAKQATTTATTTTTTTTESSVGGAGQGGAPQGGAAPGGAPQGGASQGGAPPDDGAPSDVYPAPHAKAPKVITGGGPVMQSPQIYPVFFSNDDASMAKSIEDYTNAIGPSDYWNAIGKEYGVGPATGHPLVTLEEAAPAKIDDSEIQTWLAAKLNADDPTLPAPDHNTLIALYYPPTTTITMQGGGMGGGVSSSCQQFGGYHSNVQLDANHGSKQVAYAVLPRCKDFGGLTDLDALTGTASHEYMEAATDPYPMSLPGYAQVDDAHIYWEFALGGGEIGDMCAQNPDAFGKVPGLDYVVQRQWSNKAAAAGHDPCVPAPEGVAYFNATPVMTDDLKLGGGGQSLTMKGVKIPVGQEKTIDVELFSDGKTGPFTVDAIDYGKMVGGKSTLSFSWDRQQGVNGEKLHLTIKALAKNQYGAAIFFLSSHLGNERHYWVGIVGN
jgi:hypothetical protein